MLSEVREVPENSSCLRKQGFAGNKPLQPHLWHGWRVCAGCRTRSRRKDEGIESLDLQGRVISVSGGFLMGGEPLSRFLKWILSAEQEGFVSISCRTVTDGMVFE